MEVAGETIEALRERLTTAAGQERVALLLKLGNAFLLGYHAGKPADAAALTNLNEAIEVLNEAHREGKMDDSTSGLVAAQLAWAHGIRYTAHQGAESDNEASILRAEEALDSAQLSAAQQATTQALLGMQYIGGLANKLGETGMLLAVPPSDHVLKMERAIGYLRQAVASEAITPGLKEATEMMLSLAKVMSTAMTGLTGQPGSLDLNAILTAVSKLQDLQDSFSKTTQRDHTSLLVTPLLLPGALDRPVAVLSEADPTASGAARKPQAETAAQQDIPELRRSLHSTLGVTTDVYDALDGLVHLDAPLPAPEVVDELVAQAVMIVDSGRGDATDRLILATALYQRDLIDGGSWDISSADSVAAAKSLLEAANELAGQSHGADRVIRNLAGLVRARLPAFPELESLRLRLDQLRGASGV